MNRKSQRARAPEQGAAKPIDLGPMPVWDLGDLYPAPEAKAVQVDLEKAAAEAQRIKGTYQGKLAALAGDGAALAEAIAAYESLSDTIGKLGSYAGLLYAADTSDPVKAKFYGDIQDKITAITTDLIFFELELNKIEEAALARALEVPALARYKPWIEDLRKDKPYQLEEQLERLFHEKSITSHSAWGRLFSETMTGLRFEVEGEKAPLALEPTLNFLMSPDERKRRAAAEALTKVFRDNNRLFTLITNTLAKDKEISDRWRGFKDVADSRHLANRVEREVVEALVGAVRAAYPKTAHRYYAMKAKWLGKKKLAYWDRNAPLPDKPERVVPWADAQAMVLDAYARLRPGDGEHRQALLRWRLDRRAGARGQGARRLLAPDRTLGAPLHPHELSGQVARCDDAGARAGPRRASGAGRTPGCRCWRRRRSRWPRRPPCSARC